MQFFPNYRITLTWHLASEVCAPYTLSRLSGLGDCTDLLGSAVLHPRSSLHIGSPFCVLLLTTGTGKYLQRFVPDSTDEGETLSSVVW